MWGDFGHRGVTSDTDFVFNIHQFIATRSFLTSTMTNICRPIHRFTGLDLLKIAVHEYLCYLRNLIVFKFREILNFYCVCQQLSGEYS